MIDSGYEHGFVTDIESDTVPPGLDEDTIRLISGRKNEPDWMLESRLKAYRHWLTMVDPDWAQLSEDQSFYCRQRGLSEENAVSMLVNGFCKEVFQELPMEFAVEA